MSAVAEDFETGAKDVGGKLKSHLVTLGAVASLIAIYYLYEQQRAAAAATVPAATSALPPTADDSAALTALQQQLATLLANQAATPAPGASVALTFSTDNSVSGSQSLSGQEATQTGSSTVSSGSSSGSGSANIPGVGGFSLGGGGSSSSGKTTGTATVSQYGATTAASYNDKGTYQIQGSNLDNSQLDDLLSFLTNEAGTYAQRAAQQNANATSLQNQQNAAGNQVAGLQAGATPNYAAIKPITPMVFGLNHGAGEQFTEPAVNPQTHLPQLAVFRLLVSQGPGPVPLANIAFVNWA